MSCEDFTIYIKILCLIVLVNITNRDFISHYITINIRFVYFIFIKCHAIEPILDLLFSLTCCIKCFFIISYFYIGIFFIINSFYTIQF